MGRLHRPRPQDDRPHRRARQGVVPARRRAGAGAHPAAVPRLAAGAGPGRDHARRHLLRRRRTPLPDAAGPPGARCGAPRDVAAFERRGAVHPRGRLGSGGRPRGRHRRARGVPRASASRTTASTRRTRRSRSRCCSRAPRPPPTCGPTWRRLGRPPLATGDRLAAGRSAGAGPVRRPTACRCGARTRSGWSRPGTTRPRASGRRRWADARRRRRAGADRDRAGATGRALPAGCGPRRDRVLRGRRRRTRRVPSDGRRHRCRAARGRRRPVRPRRRPAGAGGRAGELARDARALPALRRADPRSSRPGSSAAATSTGASTTRAPTPR